VSVVWLVAIATALAVAWIAAGALALLAKFVPFVTRIGANPLTALRAGLVVAPWLMATLTLSLALVPSLFAACHCFAHAPHRPHLCLQHPFHLLSFSKKAPHAGWSLVAIGRIHVFVVRAAPTRGTPGGDRRRARRLPSRREQRRRASRAAPWSGRRDRGRSSS
jgi:hypothetical protein